MSVGLPIGLIFNLLEDAAIYKYFFEILLNAFGFPIQVYISDTISDQGSPLMKAIKDLGLDHIFCLRHWLVSSKKRGFLHKSETWFLQLMNTTSMCFLIIKIFNAFSSIVSLVIEFLSKIHLSSIISLTIILKLSIG